MGNSNSGAGHGKYVLPHAECAINEEDAVDVVVNENGHSSSRKKMTSSDKQSTNGSTKCKSRLRQTFSLSLNRARKESRKAGVVVGLESVEPPIKSSLRQPAQRHSSVPLSEPSPKKTAKTNTPQGGKFVQTSQKMSCCLEKYAEGLITLSAVGERPGYDLIKRDVFYKSVMFHGPIASQYFWLHFCNYQDAATINKAKFVRSAEQFYTPITDKAQISFYMKIFGKGNDIIQIDSFVDFLLGMYQLSTKAPANLASLTDASEPFDGKEWFESVAKSCFHLKKEMSLVFTSNWILTNLPRILISTHKNVLQDLTTGYARVAVSTPERRTPATSPTAGLSIVDEYLLMKEARLGSHEATVLDSPETSTLSDPSTLHPIMLWLLTLSLPCPFVAVLDAKKPDQALRPEAVNTKQLIKEMLENKSDLNKWSKLYHSDEHGLSINRIQYHVFDYRGPTLMFVRAENGYMFCIAVDAEWRESCHFWGAEDSMLIQLLPEFKIVEKGAKMVYVNFSIRGYPFGIQVGKDPRNVSVEIKPDFEYINFKKMPCRILHLEVWGCAPCTEKKAQVDQKKWEAKEVEKQRKINLNTVDWNDNPDKYLLELGGAYKSYGDK